ncbi:MAG: BTAD domain-containing putative transcriptional regulator, partial [Gemmatimonadaceae bacterium]
DTSPPRDRNGLTGKMGTPHHAEVSSKSGDGNVLHINTFNGFSLHRSDGAPLRELPRRLAAIAVLMAHGGEQGASRERMLELLWSGHDPVKARHALTQSIYSLRRAFESDEAILGTSQLSLNAELVRTDLTEFAAADQSGDDAAAVSVYRGPFLDGFFVSGAADLEQWISLRRDEFARKVAQKLERLASHAEQQGRLTEAASHWRQRSAIDPLDATVVLSLMRVLAESGNAAAALQQGRIYEKMVAQELELPPDQRIVQYGMTLAEGQATPPAAAVALTIANESAALTLSTTASATNGARELNATVPTVESIPPAARVDPSALAALPNEPIHTRRRGLFSGRTAMLGAAAVLMLAVLEWRWLGRAPKATAPLASIAVLPFRASGADAALGFLQEGMVDLLVHALEEGDSAGVVDAGRTIGAWRGRMGTGRGEVPADSMLRLAQSLGAREAVIGAAVGTPQHLILTASLLDSRAGTRLAYASANGPVDSLPRMARRIAVQLVAQAAGESEVTAGNPALEMAALRAYLRGRDAQRRGEWRLALAGYSSAVRIDSTFAPAALGMALAADWLEEWQPRARALSLAHAHRSVLTIRERAQLDAVAGARYPDPSPSAEQLVTWERAAALAPEREELWIELGRRLLHEGGAAGVPRPMERARRALARAVSLNAHSLPARRAMLTLMLAGGDRAALLRWRNENPRGTDSTQHDVSEAWRVATALNDEAALLRLRPSLDTLDDDALRRIAMFGIHDAAQVADGWRAAQQRVARVSGGEAHTDALLAQHAYAMVGGRPSEALRILHALSEEPTSHGAHLRLQVLDALYSDGDSVTAAAAAQELAAHEERPIPESLELRATYLADVCVSQQWKAWHGDYSGGTRAMRMLQLPLELRYFGPGMANGVACSALLDAIASVRQRTPRATEALLHLESLSLAGPTAGDLRHYTPLAIARLRGERGELDAALIAVRRRLYGREWPRYLATSLLVESQLSEKLGDRPAARRALERYLALRVSPESTTAGALADARERLLALAGS